MSPRAIASANSSPTCGISSGESLPSAMARTLPRLSPTTGPHTRVGPLGPSRVGRQARCRTRRPLTVPQMYPYCGYWVVALAEHSCPGARHLTAPLIVARVCPAEQVFPAPAPASALALVPAAAGPVVTAVGAAAVAEAAGVAGVWAFAPQPVRVTAAARVRVRVDVPRFKRWRWSRRWSGRQHGSRLLAGAPRGHFSIPGIGHRGVVARAVDPAPTDRGLRGRPVRGRSGCTSATSCPAYQQLSGRGRSGVPSQASQSTLRRRYTAVPAGTRRRGPANSKPAAHRPLARPDQTGRDQSSSPSRRPFGLSTPPGCAGSGSPPAAAAALQVPVRDRRADPDLVGRAGHGRAGRDQCPDPGAPARGQDLLGGAQLHPALGPPLGQGRAVPQPAISATPSRSPSLRWASNRPTGAPSPAAAAGVFTQPASASASATAAGSGPRSRQIARTRSAFTPSTLDRTATRTPRLRARTSEPASCVQSRTRRASGSCATSSTRSCAVSSPGLDPLGSAGSLIDGRSLRRPDPATRARAGAGCRAGTR